MIVFDTETTDLIKSIDLPDKVQPRIIELYAEKLDDVTLEPVDVYHQMFNPGFDVTDEITKITSITNEMLKGKPSFTSQIREVSEFWFAQRWSVGHNIMFDLDMLFVEVRRAGLLRQFPWSPSILCTVEATEHLAGRRLSLTDLHKHLFGEAFDNAHRAKADVQSTARCLRELVRRGELRIR